MPRRRRVLSGSHMRIPFWRDLPCSPSAGFLLGPPEEDVWKAGLPSMASCEQWVGVEVRYSPSGTKHSIMKLTVSLAFAVRAKKVSRLRWFSNTS